MDVSNAVVMATTWSTLPPEVIHDVPLAAVNLPIPDNNGVGVSNSLVIATNLQLNISTSTSAPTTIPFGRTSKSN